MSIFNFRRMGGKPAMPVQPTVAIDNRLSFDTTDEGTSAMFVAECSARRRFFSRISPNAAPNADKESLMDDYFGPF